MKTILIYVAGWLGMIMLAILNGVIRETVYGQMMRELSAHQLSTLTLLLLFGGYVWILSRFFRLESSRQAFVIGGIWLIMTVAFEFLFGRYVMDHSWGRLFHDYNLLKGRIWCLMLIWTAVAPYVFYQIEAGKIYR